MNITADEIERIIREVLSRLAAASTGSASADAPAAAPSSELVLSEKLVTVRDIERRLQGITKLSVGPRTIVTPAVRDLLRDKKIDFVRRSAG